MCGVALDYIDTLQVAYTWYSDDTAIGLTLLDKYFDDIFIIILTF